MAKKEYPAWHYFLAAALAFPIGILFTFYMFQIVMGPGMLAASIWFLVVGFKKRKARRSPLQGAGLLVPERPPTWLPPGPSR